MNVKSVAARSRLSFRGAKYLKKLPPVPLAVLLLFVAASLLAPWLAPYDPDQQDLLLSLEMPSWTHWLGTDDQGRDLLSRLLFSLRVDLLAAFQAVAIGVLLGSPLGVLLGMSARWVDKTLMRVVDAALAIPPIVLILAVVAVVGRGLIGAMVALGIVFSFAFLRLARGEIILLRNAPYVQAALCAGVPVGTLMWRHLLPGILPALVIQIGLFLPVALLVEASLSYLGLSVQPPQSSLGSMLLSAQSASLMAPWQVLPPGLVLIGVAWSLNALTDAISASLRPRRTPLALLASAGGRLGMPRRIEPVSPDSLPLEVSGLHIAVEDEQGLRHGAVRDVSFTVGAGEVVAIVGESGSGKSLTAVSIPGLLPAGATVEAGVVKVCGHDVLNASPARLRALRTHCVSMVFQDPHSCLNPAYPLGEQLMAPLTRLKGLSSAQARQQVIALLDEVGITEPERRLAQYPHEISGGMAQRVMIALALAHEPQLIIADEATSALDTTVQAQVIDLLMQLIRKRKVGLLLITHSMGVVHHIADRVLVMYSGEVVEGGPTQMILARPEHPYTQALLAAVPRNQQGHQVAVLEGAAPRPGTQISGCRFAARCPIVASRCEQTAIPLLVQGEREMRCIRSQGI